MLAFIFNFGTLEILLMAIVAVLVFGRNLPTVAVQAAGVVQKMRRSLADLRRQTGIDEELRNVRRTINSAVPDDVRRMDVREIVRRQVEDATRADDDVADQKGEDPGKGSAASAPSDPPGAGIEGKEPPVTP